MDNAKFFNLFLSEKTILFVVFLLAHILIFLNDIQLNTMLLKLFLTSSLLFSLITAWGQSTLHIKKIEIYIDTFQRTSFEYQGLDEISKLPHQSIVLEKSLQKWIQNEKKSVKWEWKYYPALIVLENKPQRVYLQPQTGEIWDMSHQVSYYLPSEHHLLWQNTIEKEYQILLEKSKLPCLQNRDLFEEPIYASFEGGILAFRKKLQARVAFYQQDLVLEKREQVTASFVINEYGMIGDFKIIKTTHPLLASIALKALEDMAPYPWYPAFQIRCMPCCITKYTKERRSIPIYFEVLKKN